MHLKTENEYGIQNHLNLGRNSYKNILPLCKWLDQLNFPCYKQIKVASIFFCCIFLNILPFCVCDMYILAYLPFIIIRYPFKVTFSTRCGLDSCMADCMPFLHISLLFGSRSSIFQAFLSFLTASFQFLRGRPLETLPSILVIHKFY